MPTYTYRCGGCGPFDVLAPIAASGDDRQCPVCGAPANRVFCAPGIRRTAPALGRALDADERSRHEPTVTTSVPAGGRTRRATPITRDPRHARLPRP